MSKNIDMPLLVEEFKVRLEADPNFTLAQFAREKGVGERRMQRWCNDHQISVTDLRTQVLIKQGVLDAPRTKPDTRYRFLFDEYKKELLQRRTLTLSVFCRERGESPTRMSKWLNRQGLSAADVKRTVLEQGVEPSVAESVLLGLAPGAIARFRQTLKGYKDLLSKSTNKSMKDYCAECNVDFPMFTKWLAAVGVSDRSLRREARVNRKKPGGEFGSVFVQFKPNGGSVGDQLRGVKIFFPDGSRIEVEGCTVITLCNFIHTYDNQQRRKNLQKDV